MRGVRPLPVFLAFIFISPLVSGFGPVRIPVVAYAGKNVKQFFAAFFRFIYFARLKLIPARRGTRGRVSEVDNQLPRLRFGLVGNGSFETVRSINPCSIGVSSVASKRGRLTNRGLPVKIMLDGLPLTEMVT